VVKNISRKININTVSEISGVSRTPFQKNKNNFLVALISISVATRVADEFNAIALATRKLGSDLISV
jgi:hypothetical protein